MISYMISYHQLWYDIRKTYYKKPFLHESSTILTMISYMISRKKTWFWQWYQKLMILPMTSWYNSYVLATDIRSLWYWGRLISLFYDILAYIMAPGRREGEGWGHHGPAAPPAPASPPPTYWGQVLSWTATDLIPRMDRLQWLLRA